MVFMSMSRLDGRFHYPGRKNRFGPKLMEAKKKDFPNRGAQDWPKPLANLGPAERSRESTRARVMNPTPARVAALSFFFSSASRKKIKAEGTLSCSGGDR